MQEKSCPCQRNLETFQNMRRCGRPCPPLKSYEFAEDFHKNGIFCGRTEASAPTEFPKIFCFCAGEVRQKSGRCGHTSRVEGRLIGGFSAKSMYHGRTLSICSLMCILPNQFLNYFRYKSFIFYNFLCYFLLFYILNRSRT